MSTGDDHPRVHQQLSSHSFSRQLDDMSSDDENSQVQTGVANTPTDQPDHVRVSRPRPPIDFTLTWPITSLQDLNDLAFRPVALNTRVTCRICRFRDGLDKLYPQYQLFVEHLATSAMHHVMTARKEPKSQTSYYTISGVINDGESQPELVPLGKVRSNFLGTNFMIYSHGRKPVKNDSQATKDLPIREELGAVLYDPNLLGFKGPRKMTILSHVLTRDGTRPEFRPTNESDGLLEKYRAGGASDLLVMRNKDPQWNEETQSFVLNFNGRVTQASVKNFQIVHDNDLDYIVMQFGRVDRDYFTMDYKYPICLLQAFAIALTSFDAKLACE